LWDRLGGRRFGRLAFVDELHVDRGRRGGKVDDSPSHSAEDRCVQREADRRGDEAQRGRVARGGRRLVESAGAKNVDDAPAGVLRRVVDGVELGRVGAHWPQNFTVIPA
jgi:hypothetical protein